MDPAKVEVKNYVAVLEGELVLEVLVATMEFAARHVGGELIDVTNEKPRPAPDWTYVAGKFAPPPEPKTRRRRKK